MKEREGYHKRVMEKEHDLENKRENVQVIARVSIAVIMLLFSSKFQS